MPEEAVVSVVHDPAAAPVAIDHVSVGYDGTAALQDVSLSVAAGERVAVVGPNGAGKTTLLKVIGGILRPSRGAVRVYGHRPGGHICVAYVPQRSQVDWDFPARVSEIVMMGRIRKIGLFRWPAKTDWETVDWALDRVGMQAFAGKQIGELSGGQQQRVFLAQALAQEAELILLDEPLTGLDSPSQEAIFGLLDDLRGGGVPAIVSTHDLNLAAERFDRVALLHRRLVAFGPPAAVLTRENLAAAYGGHLHLLPETGGVMVITDTCCEGEEEAS